MSDCGNPDCFCCGDPHWCEPPNYPTALGQRWACPECGLIHEAFDASEDPMTQRMRLPTAARYGWKSVSKPVRAPESPLTASQTPGKGMGAGIETSPANGHTAAREDS